jgi:mycothiol conjugate amidase Mca
MRDQSRALLAVFAHPDDEVWVGATLAKYADLGVRTIMVTATLGEEGEIRDPDLNPEEAKERLGEIREAELRRSAEILNVGQVYILGFRDSGMAGTPANEHPENFHNADPGEAVGRLVRIIRKERPQVVITDNERGTYGHPDHLAANRTALAAFEAAGDPSRFPEQGLEPWEPKKLYYAAFPHSDFVRLAQLMKERGIQWGSEEEAEEAVDFTTPDEEVTTRVEIGPYGPRVREAMQAHRTQIAQDDPFMSMPEDLMAEVFRANAFTRVRSLVEAALPEDDLFAGL